MANQTGNRNEEGPSTSVNVGFIRGDNNIKNTINVNNNNNTETVNIFNKIEKKDKPLKNVTLNCLSASSCFKGREETLSNILKNIKSNKMVVVHGSPGIGKTETARQFTIKNKNYFKGNLIWLFAETRENLEKCFKDLSLSLGLQVTDVSQIYAKFRTSRCLFIFDNVENMASIKHYLPPSHLSETVKILITSQCSKWDTSVCKIPLEALKMKDALRILNAKLGDEYEEYPIAIWEDLVEYLEGIPLSLQIVSSLIKEEISQLRISSFNLETFISGLKDNLINLKVPDSELITYNNNVFSSIRFALERLKYEENSRNSLDLLGCMGYLDPDHIYSKHLLSFPSIENSETELKAVLNELVKYSLIQVERDYVDGFKIKIHRTVQLVLREFDLKEQNGSMFKTTIKSFINLSEYDYFDTRFGHIRSVFEYVNKEEFHVKSLEFYEENYIENKAITYAYLKKLALFNCSEVLQELLPIFKQEYFGTDNYNKTLNEILYWTIYKCNNNMSAINQLINNYGAKIEISSHNKVNGFHLASDWLSIELFDLLLETNDSEDLINSKDEWGQTILHRLIKDCNKENMEETMECMDHLISKWNADISIRGKRNNTILHAAFQNKKICLQMIKYLVEKCNCKYLINQQNEWGETPLHHLFDWSHSIPELLEIVSYFINKCDVDITIQDKDKWNSLFYVCRYGTSEIIDFVLKNTDDYREIINHQNIVGNVAFTYLIHNRQIKEQEIIELMKLFIEYEMDFKIRNNRNESLVEIAEIWEYKKLSNELKKHLKVPPRNTKTFCSII